jgi:hypothetical protein
MAYSLKEAAAAVGKQKPAILKAIQSGKISGQKDARGEWQIEPAELHRVYPHVSKEAASETGSMEPEETIGNPNGNSLLRQEVQFLREKLSDHERMTETERRQLSDRIEDLRGERDRLLKVIEEQAGSFRVLTDQRQPQQPKAAAAPPKPEPKPAPPKGWRGLLYRLAGAG